MSDEASAWFSLVVTVVVSCIAAEADMCLMSSEGTTFASLSNPLHLIRELSGLKGAGRCSWPYKEIGSVNTVGDMSNSIGRITRTTHSTPLEG